MDCAAYMENPGASDSEDEDADDFNDVGPINAALLSSRRERAEHGDDSKVADVDFSEYLFNYEQEEEEKKVSNERLGLEDVMSGSAIIAGAPPGWKPPQIPPDWKPTKPVGLIANKPGVTRGGQIVLVSDIDRIRPRVYIHRHKKRENHFKKGGMGMTEVMTLLDMLEPCIVRSAP